MINKLHEHLISTQILPQDSSLVLAVSGGVDSVAMLDLLSQLAPKWGWRLQVAHLDHNLRGESSNDANLVAHLADQYGHKFFLNQLVEPENSEAALRSARYNFLETIREGANADYIVTAHHSDDRLETAIFNSIRGADRYGLTSMRPIQGNIVRPLLPFTKGQLITYVNTNELPYSNDETNDDVKYSRNFIRHNVIPQSSVVDPDFRAKHLDIINNLEKLSEQIDWQLSQVLDMVSDQIDENSISLRRDGFLKLTELVQFNLLSYICRQISGGINISQANLARGLIFIQTAPTGTISNAIPSLIMERVYDRVIVAHKDSLVTQSITTLPLKSDQSLTHGNWRITLNSKPTTTKAPNYLIKPSTLYLRGWQAGDRIAPVGMTGSKKLQDIFTDKKIPRRDRAAWPVIVDGQNKPIAAAGLVIARDVLAKVDEPHYQLIFEEI